VGLNILGTLGYVDQIRVAVYGHSMGGYLTVGLLIHNASQRIKVAAYTSAGFKYGSTPAEQEQFAAQINAPLLMMHGTADPVPFSDSQALADLLTRLGKPNQLIPFEGVAHDLPQTRTADVTREAIQYFTAHF